MKEVAIIAPNSFPVPPIRGGGIQTAITETTPFYKEYKPYIFSNCEYGIDKLPLKETVGNIEHRRICQSPWDEFKIKITHLTIHNYFPYVFEIIRQIKEIKPGVIHLMNRPWFLPILRKYLGSEIKIILHHFNNYLMEMPKKKAGGYLALIDGFIGCSKFTVDHEVSSRFPEYNSISYIVGNGVDIGKFNRDKLNANTLSALRNKYGLKIDDVAIMYVGRLVEDKGALQLLKAFKKVLSIAQKKQLKLLIVGSSFYGGETKTTPFIEELHKASESIKENIVFTGFVDRNNIQNTFGVGDIVVIPSIVQDASPIVAYEASAMKIPVVGTKRGGIPELVKDGETGLIVNDPYDIDDLAEKILYLVERPDKRKSFGENGRAFMEKNYDWKIIAGKMEEVYNKVLKGRQR